MQGLPVCYLLSLIPEEYPKLCLLHLIFPFSSLIILEDPMYHLMVKFTFYLPLSFLLFQTFFIFWKLTFWHGFNFS